jgi:anti-sigma B factor antagonist
MSHFNFQSVEKGDVIVLKLVGSLIDSSHCITLLDKIEEFIEKGKSKFVLDMGEFVYMNSNGLSVIINLLTKARNSDGDVVICSITKKNNDILVITKLSSVFTVLDNETEAVNYFK